MPWDVSMSSHPKKHYLRTETVHPFCCFCLCRTHKQEPAGPDHHLALWSLGASPKRCIRVIESSRLALTSEYLLFSTQVVAHLILACTQKCSNSIQTIYWCVVLNAY